MNMKVGGRKGNCEEVKLRLKVKREREREGGREMMRIGKSKLNPVSYLIDKLCFSSLYSNSFWGRGSCLTRLAKYIHTYVHYMSYETGSEERERERCDGI
jgi:hypothetical protein